MGSGARLTAAACEALKSNKKWGPIIKVGIFPHIAYAQFSMTKIHILKIILSQSFLYNENWRNDICSHQSYEAIDEGSGN